MRIARSPFETLLQIIKMLKEANPNYIPVITESIKQTLQTSVVNILLVYYALTKQKVFKVLYKCITSEQLDLIPIVLKVAINDTDVSKLVDPEQMFVTYQKNVHLKRLNEKLQEFLQNGIHNEIIHKYPHMSIDDAFFVYCLYGDNWKRKLEQTKQAHIKKLDWFTFSL